MSNIYQRKGLEIFSENCDTPLIVQEGDVDITNITIFPRPNKHGYFGEGTFNKRDEWVFVDSSFPFILDFEGRTSGTFFISGNPTVNNDGTVTIDSRFGTKYTVREM